MRLYYEATICRSVLGQPGIVEGGSSPKYLQLLSNCFSALMQAVMQRWLEQRAAIKFCMKLYNFAVKTFRMIKMVFGDNCLSSVPVAQDFFRRL